jgi:hypothetical protein
LPGIGKQQPFYIDTERVDPIAKAALEARLQADGLLLIRTCIPASPCIGLD